jgi:signal peptidase I
MGKMSRGKLLDLMLVGALAGVFVCLPLYTQTSNFPLAIVQGNSMYPNLHNGDLVLFGRAPQGVTKNGTVIVFVQGDTGVSSLDSLVRPVVIHRIVGVVIQADGTIYYRTKGDNNQFVDPALTEANHVLGVPIAVVPSVGVVVLFLGSPQGLVTLIGTISMYYVGRFEMAAKEEKKKNELLGDLTKLVFEREITQEELRRLEFVVKFGKTVQVEGQGDALQSSLLAWINKGALDRGWKLEKTLCPKCSAPATGLVCPKDNSFTVCRNCIQRTEERGRIPMAGTMPLPQGHAKREVPLSKVPVGRGSWKAD